MPNLQDIRKRIKSVKNTQQITRAMKMVASAKLRKAQDRALNARPFAEGMLEVVRDVAARAEAGRHRLLQSRSDGFKLFVAVSADRGLCGGFNVNVCKHAVALVKESLEQGKDAKLYVVGKKANDFFKRRDYEVVKHKMNIFQKLEFGHGSMLGDELMELYLEGDVGEVVLVYNRFKSMVSQEVTAVSLLPFTAGEKADEKADEKAGKLRPGQLDYIYEPNADAILNKLLPLAVHIEVFHALLESSAAEQAARMLAMDNATNNAGEMIDKLTLNMNKVRQASITRELIEVVSGAQSLE